MKEIVAFDTCNPFIYDQNKNIEITRIVVVYKRYEQHNQLWIVEIPNSESFDKIKNSAVKSLFDINEIFYLRNRENFVAFTSNPSHCKFIYLKFLFSSLKGWLCYNGYIKNAGTLSYKGLIILNLNLT